MESSNRKRKSTDRGSDGGSSDDEQEIEEEQAVPLVQHQPGQGMHYGLLETQPPSVPSSGHAFPSIVNSRHIRGYTRWLCLK